MDLKTRPSCLGSESNIDSVRVWSGRCPPQRRSQNMKLKLLIALFALSILFGGLIVSAQDEDVRGAFIESRPKTTNLNGPSRRHRRRPANTNANSGGTTSSNAATNANANSAVNRNDVKRMQLPIGLGYTVFMRDASG